MRTLAIGSVFFALGVVAAALFLRSPGAPGEAGASGTGAYVCPMHPQVTSGQPDRCTICGMNLVPRASHGGGGASSAIMLGAAQVTAIGVQTSEVAKRPLVKVLRVSGRVEDDESKHRVISARVPGRIEKLNVAATGQVVGFGAVLATIFSAEMLSAQRQYLEQFALGPQTVARSQIAAARERLQLLGLTDEGIADLEKSGQPSALVDVRAPGLGTVIAKSVFEGQYVQTGDPLFETGDFTRMWFVFDAYEQDLPWLTEGLEVHIFATTAPGQMVMSRIAYIDPNLDPVTRTARVRVVIEDPHLVVGEAHVYLAHRAPATGVVFLEPPVVLAAPKSAVLDTGTGALAYVETGAGVYERRPVSTGRRGEALVEILSGLAEGERVVTQGALLIDAQSKLMSGGPGR